MTFQCFILLTLKVRKVFGVTLAQVHSICTDSVRDFFTDNNLRKKEYINFYIESLKNRVAKFEDPVYINCLLNISEMFNTVSFTEVLNHGDYHFWNTILTNDNKLYILDWEKAFIGDPRYDIANTLVLGYSWFGTNFKEPMLDAYQNITNKKIEHLECFTLEGVKPFFLIELSGQYSGIIINNKPVSMIAW